MEKWGGLVCNNGNNIGTKGNIGTTGTIVRYNISVNDGLRNFQNHGEENYRKDRYFSPIFDITGPVTNTRIYNNIIFVPVKPRDMIDRTLVEMGNWGGSWPENTLVTNNIFVTKDTADFQWGRTKSYTFKSNLFYDKFKNLPDDPQAIFEDPMFMNPAVSSRGLESLWEFKLKKNSPAVNVGVKLLYKERIRDFFGRMVDPKEQMSIGIQEFSDK